MSPVKEVLFERLWTTLFEGCTPAEQEVMLRVLEQVFERAQTMELEACKTWLAEVMPKVQQLVPLLRHLNS